MPAWIRRSRAAARAKALQRSGPGYKSFEATWSCDVRLVPRAKCQLVAPILEQIDPDLHVGANRGSSLMPLDPATARFQLFDGISRFLRKEAQERPLVLLFDDLHRSDVASLLLLRFAARELRNARILFVATFRDTESADDPTRASLLGELAREEGARSVQLSGLSREDVGLLVNELGLAQDPEMDLLRLLHDQSGGNPFFVTQLLQLFEGRTAMTCDAPFATEAFAPPGGLREAILGQVEGLPPRTREILAAAAVAGREFSVAVLAAAVDETFEQILEHLTPAERRRIVNPNPELPGHYRFAHVLLRDALYEQLPAAHRIHLHLRIGQALEHANEGNLGPVAAELSHHFFEAAHAGGAALGGALFDAGCGVGNRAARLRGCASTLRDGSEGPGSDPGRVPTGAWRSSSSR